MAAPMKMKSAPGKKPATVTKAAPVKSRRIGSVSAAAATTRKPATGKAKTSAKAAPRAKRA